MPHGVTAEGDSVHNRVNETGADSCNTQDLQEYFHAIDLRFGSARTRQAKFRFRWLVLTREQRIYPIIINSRQK